MTHAELSAIAADLKFRDWECRVMVKGDGFLLQWLFYAPDSAHPEQVALQACRKWYVSSHSSKGEVIRTAWKGIEAAVLHEAQEHFRYKGRMVHNPHADPEALADVATLSLREVG